MRNRICLKLAILGIAAVVLTGCSTYPSKFKCGDAKGLGCTMLRDVDTQIKSGEIDEAYRGTKRCRGNHCVSLESNLKEDVPILAPTNKATITSPDQERNIDIINDENNLYF
jgi:hypothetical protein